VEKEAMIGQKDAVVAQVRAYLGNTFTPYKDIALVMLSTELLESLKKNVAEMIINGTIEYSKDRANTAEVVAYARSMVMNHLKKAKELNGNQVYGVGPAKEPKAIKSNIDKSILTPDLKEFVDTLV
jgi:hypothetical protein